MARPSAAVICRAEASTVLPVMKLVPLKLCQARTCTVPPLLVTDPAPPTKVRVLVLSVALSVPEPIAASAAI